MSFRILKSAEGLRPLSNGATWIKFQIYIGHRLFGKQLAAMEEPHGAGPETWINLWDEHQADDPDYRSAVLVLVLKNCRIKSNRELVVAPWPEGGVCSREDDPRRREMRFDLYCDKVDLYLSVRGEWTRDELIDFGCTLRNTVSPSLSVVLCAP